MKKHLSVLLIVVLLASFLCACGNSTQPSDSPNPSAAPASEVKVRTFTVATGGSSQSSPIGVGADEFAKKLEEYSGGTLRADVYYDTQLGSTQDLVDGIQQGTVDFTEAGNSFFSAYVPELQAIELPFLFDSYDQARSILQGAAGEYVKAKFEGTGIKILAFWEIGFRHMTNNDHAIHSIEDVNGLKIRTLPAAVQVAAWETFGAVPTPIDFSELYTSLQQGVVSGQENPLSEIYSKKFYEIQKYITLTGHVYTPGPFACSEATWNSLTEQEQEWVMMAVEDATAAMFSANDALETNALSEMEAYGCEIDRDPDVTGFQEKAETVYSIFTDQYGTEFLDLIIASK